MSATATHVEWRTLLDEYEQSLRVQQLQLESVLEDPIVIDLPPFSMGQPTSELPEELLPRALDLLHRTDRLVAEAQRLQAHPRLERMHGRANAERVTLPTRLDRKL
jgi:hypothetical protein